MNCSRSILPIMLMMAVLSPVARAQSTLDRPPTTSTSLQALDGQPRSKPDAIRWIVGVENAERTERAGGFAIWGAQRSLRVSVGIGNTEGPKVTSSADLTKGIVINMRHGGVELPISCELADTGSRTLELDEGGGRHISILVTPRSAPGFQPGTYEFTVSLEKLLASLVLADNTPWPGSAKVKSRHQIVLRPVATADDRAAFDQQEANALIALRRPADAIPFVEELTRLRPESWYAWAFLGNTYRRANRLTQAIAAYERSRQGWLGVRSPRNDQIAFELAATYTLAGLETEATMLLRHHGWSEDEIGTRLGQFRSARPK